MVSTKQDSDRIRISFFQNKIGSDSKNPLSDHHCSEYRFFALSSPGGYLLSGLRQPSHPARIFSGILSDPFYLLPARGLPAHVILAYIWCTE